MKIIYVFILLIAFNYLHGQELPCKRYFKQSEGGGCYERYREDEDGNKHGKYIQYTSEGAVFIRGSYNHGVKEGQWIDVIDYSLITFFSDEQITYFTILDRETPVKSSSYIWYERGKIIYYDDVQIPSYSFAKQKEAELIKKNK